MTEPQIVMIPSPLKHPVTGGEIYEAKLFDYLRKTFLGVEPITITAFQRPIRAQHRVGDTLFFGLRSIVRNVLYLVRIATKYYQRTVILEDAYYAAELFLFNFLIRRIRKDVTVVPIVHHLSHHLMAGKVRQVVLKTLEACFLNESHWIIVNSDATKHAVQQLLKEAKVFLVAYPGVSEERAGFRARAVDCNRESGPVQILTVGSVTERKDLETLLNAVRTLLDRYNESNFVVTIVGDIEKDKVVSAEIIKMMDVLSISNYVMFTGTVDDQMLRDVYAQSDIFVSTSRYEGFGMAIIEAMHNQLPVVATNGGNVPYLVEDDVTGFVVPSGDHEGLAERMKRLLDSEGLRKTMGTNGFSRTQEFDWDRTFKRIIEKLLEP